MARKMKRPRTEYESRGPSDDDMLVEETTPPRRSSKAQTKKNKNKGKVIKILVKLKNETSEMRKLFGNLIQSNNNQSKMLKKLIKSHTNQSKNLEKLTESHNDLCKQWELHTNSPRSQWNQEQPPRYQLVFKSNVTEKIEKGQTIEIHVALVDANNGQTVKNGPLASATVELVVIDAKFNQNDNQYNWSTEDFMSSIKKARQGNSATVHVDQSGKSIVSNGRFNLENGDKHHCNFTIFSNSSNKKVRLGVMLVSPTQERVLEGLSNPFFVRGHDRPNRMQAKVDNGNQEQNGPMSNMQNPSCPNSTQADVNAQARVDNGNQEQNGPMSNMENASCPNSTQADVNAQARVDNSNQEQNGPMSNMQNSSCPNSTQADGNGCGITHMLEGQHMYPFQRTTPAFSTEPAIYLQHQVHHPSMMAEAWNNQNGVHDGCPEQNGAMPTNPLWQNPTQGLDTIGQAQRPFIGNPDSTYSEPSARQVQQDWISQNHGHLRNLIRPPMNSGTGMPFNTNLRTFPVRLVWDMPSVVPSKHCFNVLDQPMPQHSWHPKFKNCGLPTTSLMQERFGSLTTMPKEVMQTRRGRGVLIEPFEPDDSDEGRPLKRNLHSKYQLRFVNKVCETYYTWDQIRADEGNLLKVALFDENNTKITSGPLSSASVEVVALHGDFNCNGQDYWTSEEFSRSVMYPSPGEEASSVLGGDRILVLAGGEACLSDAFFQRTSFCARTGKFKMGVMLVSAQEERVQEGISEPFQVMHHHLPGFISNCWSWKSDLEPPVCQASTSSARMTKAVLLAASKIGRILTEEATKANITKLSEKVVNLKELPKKIEKIGKELNMMDIKIKQICTTTSLTYEFTKGKIPELQDLGYDVEDVIDEYSYYVLKLEDRVKEIFTKAQYITVFSEIAEAITQIGKKLENFVMRRDRWLYQPQHSPKLFAFADIERKRSQDCILDVVQDDLVGIEENRRLLAEWLNSEERSTTLITVSGMGGLGKTTLIKNLYEQEKNNFTAHAWIDVSHTYDVVELLRKFLRKIEDNKQQPQLAELDAYDLKQKIKERLTDRKCLIVLDDVWTQETYTQIRDAFQNLKASCVIITTRQEQVAALAHPTRQLKLKPLGYSYAFSLFCRKAFYNSMDSKCPNELEKVAKSIVERCQGVPLAIVVKGGRLSALPPVENVWNKTYKQFQDELKNNDQVCAALNLSYHDLPGNLRNCFLYCSLFPEDHMMSRDSLVWLWVAEGFAVQNDQSTPEEMAGKYLRELIQRNMLEAVENDGLGRVTTCKMHDLVRDLALSFAKEEKFGFASDYGTMVQIDKSVRRLSSLGWKDKILSIKDKIQLPHLRTLVAHGITESSPQLLSSVLSESKYLRVLELQDSEISEIPASIGNLFNLRYMGLRRTRVKSLPESISELCNLEILDIKQTKIVKLPRGIAKVNKLRHILADRYADEKQSEFRYFIGVQAPKGLSELEELQTLETVEAGKDLAEQLKQLKKLRSLWIDNIISIDCANLFTALSKMPVLSSLHLSASDEKETLCLEALKPQSEYLHKLIIRGCWADKTMECSIFQEHGKYLKYLDISWCHFQEDPLQLLAPCVPNVTYLSLYRVSTSRTLVLSPGCFPQLRSLVLKRMPCVNEVEIRVGALRQIEGLYIESLVKLDKIPQGIEFLCSLKKLWLLDLHKEFRAQWNSKGMPQKMNYVRDLCT